jgi:hypothetical protein
MVQGLEGMCIFGGRQRVVFERWKGCEVWLVGRNVDFRDVEVWGLDGMRDALGRNSFGAGYRSQLSLRIK